MMHFIMHFILADGPDRHKMAKCNTANCARKPGLPGFRILNADLG